MSTSQSTIDNLLVKASLAGEVTAKKMFGEYGLYCDGKLVGLVCDDQLFIKITAAGRQLFPDAVEAAPYPGGKPQFLVPANQWENEEWLGELIGETTKLLPAPKPKKK